MWPFVHPLPFRIEVLALRVFYLFIVSTSVRINYGQFANGGDENGTQALPRQTATSCFPAQLLASGK